ncbi:MAG: hypothetical protein ACREJ5_08260 [Geminicoccaceae bacterium]
MPPSLWNLHHWGGVGYGVLNDADGQVLYYRRDVLNDPRWQEEFKAATGHDMVVPPKTWQQVLRIAGEAALGGAQAGLEELQRVEGRINEINRQIEQNVDEIRFKTGFMQRLQVEVSTLIRERNRLRGR